MVASPPNRMRTALFSLVLFCTTAPAQLVDFVKGQTARGNFEAAEQMIAQLKAKHGPLPEIIEGHSWLGRGALAAKQLDKAEKYAAATYALCDDALKSRKLDVEPRLPTALGAAIEVQAQVLAQRGQRSEAVGYLNTQLNRYRTTSIRARIQKNIHLLSLEGKPAPPLEGVTKWQGKPTLLFFWAHWCADCKQQGPVIERLRQEFPSLQVLAPTQTYGYVGGGEDASRAVELPYIKRIFDQFYASIGPVPMPVNEENFRAYGASSTPTLVLVDKAGVVRMYHPGQMSYEELKPIFARWVK